MTKTKIYKRNKQLGKTIIILAIIVGLTLFVDSFYIDNVKIRIAQILVFVCLWVFAILEFTVPFAIETANYFIVRESPFLIKRILKIHINKVKNIKGRYIIVYCKTWRKKVIFLKSIDLSQKNNFINELSDIAYNNKKLNEKV